MAPKKDKPSPALEMEAKAPKEGTKGIIWGQQVKKPKSTGWTDELEWHNASPANVDEFLMGAEEGGKLCCACIITITQTPLSSIPLRDGSLAAWTSGSRKGCGAGIIG